MPKSAYKWPSSINASIADHEIALGSKTTAGKMVPLKQIAAAVAWIFVNAYILMSFVYPASLILAILYLIWAIVAGGILLRMTKTRELAIRQVLAYMAYAPVSSRTIMTRRDSKPAGFYNIVGIKKVHRDGLIEYADNTYGRALLVVGTASLMLFDNDRDAILDSVDSFWRKMPTDVEMIQMTTREPRRVAYQVDALQQRMKYLDVDSEDLRGLLDEQFNRMVEVSTNFSSTHQYEIVKGESLASIDTAVSLMMTEVEYSGRVFQSYQVLDTYDSVIRMLKPIYEGRQGFDARQAKLKRRNKRLTTANGKSRLPKAGASRSKVAQSRRRVA